MAYSTAPCEGRRYVIGARKASRGLTIDRDQVGVSPELPDVLLDPGQGHHLVPHTSVAGDVL